MFWPATVTNVASVFASTAARSNESSGTRASNVVVSDSAPLSWYVTPEPTSVPLACSSDRLPVMVASTFAIPARGAPTILPISSRLGESACSVRLD